MTKTKRQIDETSEWTQCNKINWEAIPRNVEIVFNEMKQSSWARYIKNMRRWLDADFEKVAANICDKLSLKNIEAAFDWIGENTDYAFTFFERRNKNNWRVSTEPKVKYRSRWNGRGLGSTYRHNYFTISNIGGIGRVGQWNRLESLCINRWDDFNEEANKRRHKAVVDSFRRRVERAERDSTAYELSYDEIKEEIFKTLDNLRRGKSGSSHGTFSFSLDYCTTFIDKETGNLIAIDKTDINWRIPDPLNIPEKYSDLRKTFYELIERFWTAQRILHQRSVVWKSAWDEVTKVMSEHSQQGVVQ